MDTGGLKRGSEDVVEVDGPDDPDRSHSRSHNHHHPTDDPPLCMVSASGLRLLLLAKALTHGDLPPDDDRNHDVTTSLQS